MSADVPGVAPSCRHDSTAGMETSTGRCAAAIRAGRGLGGLWLTIIGWFLVGAATAERQAATIRSQPGG
jgi:hypothetical protein